MQFSTVSLTMRWTSKPTTGDRSSSSARGLVADVQRLPAPRQIEARDFVFHWHPSQIT
jgi:hypothetical protein